HASVGAEARLRAREFDGATGRAHWAREHDLGLDADTARRASPGALNLVGGSVALPIATSWRGTSRAPDGERRALVVAWDRRSGALAWSRPYAQVGPELAVHEDRAHVGVDFATGEGELITLDAAGGE